MNALPPHATAARLSAPLACRPRRSSAACAARERPGQRWPAADGDEGTARGPASRGRACVHACMCACAWLGEVISVCGSVALFVSMAACACEVLCACVCVANVGVVAVAIARAALCAALHYTAPLCTSLHFTAPCCIAPHCSALYFSTVASLLSVARPLPLPASGKCFRWSTPPRAYDCMHVCAGPSSDGRQCSIFSATRHCCAPVRVPPPPQPRPRRSRSQPTASPGARWRRRGSLLYSYRFIPQRVQQRVRLLVFALAFPPYALVLVPVSFSYNYSYPQARQYSGSYEYLYEYEYRSAPRSAFPYRYSTRTCGIALLSDSLRRFLTAGMPK